MKNTRNIITILMILFFIPSIVIANEKIEFSDSKNLMESRANFFTNDGIADTEEDIKSEIGKYTINLEDVDLIQISQDHDFVEIKNFGVGSEPGNPKIPMKIIKKKLPLNSKVISVEIINGKYRDIYSELNIIPVAEPVYWNSPDTLKNQELNELKPNQNTYSSNKYFPGEIIDYYTGKDNKNNYVYIQFFPLQIIPSYGEGVLVTEIEYEIKYIIEDEENGYGIYSLVSSAESIILTPPELYDAASNLANLHENEGVNSAVIDVTWIFENYLEANDPPFDGYNDPSNPGWDTINDYDYSLAKKIISFLNDNSAHPNLEYVTIMGNGINVPPSYYFLDGFGNYDSWIPSDFFYSSPDYDLVPNFKVGRLPVNNSDEANFFVNKISNWINDVEWDWFKNVAVAGDDAFWTYYYVGELITTDVINQDAFNGMDVVKYFGSDGNFDEAHISTPLIDGEFGIFYEIGHGSGTKMCTGWTCEGEDAIEVDDLLSYPQNDKQPVLVTINCLNGAFDTYLMDTDYYGDLFPSGYSFSEASLMSNAGAIAYIGGTRINHGGIDVTLTNGSLSINSQPYMQSMLNHVILGYHNGNTRLGAITNYAINSFIEEKDFNDYSNYRTLFEFILLGDPVLKLPNQQSEESYQQPQLKALNVEEYISLYDWWGEYEGDVPLYETDRLISINSETNSPDIEIKVIDTLFKNIIYDSINSTIDDNYVYDFTLSDDSYWPYQIRTLTEDGKEGWFYLQVEEGITPLNVTNSILLVDDDIDASYEEFYSQSLLNLEYPFDVWNVFAFGSPDYDLLSNYHVVIWLTGDDWSDTLTEIDQQNLALYLDNGGKLFISGQDIGYDICWESTFYSDYLHATYIQDSTNVYILDGVDSDPISDWLIINISGGDGANNQYYPSEIDTLNGAVSIFNYNPSYFNSYFIENNNKAEENGKYEDNRPDSFGIVSSGSGALRVDTDAYKLVYFAFGFEAINNQNDRDWVMYKVINYLHPMDTNPPYAYIPAVNLGENQPMGNITISVVVVDENDISSVSATIKDSNNNLIETLILNDNGINGDEIVLDNFYTSIWSTENQDDYKIDLIVVDEFGNQQEYVDIIRFSTIPLTVTSDILLVYDDWFNEFNDEYGVYYKEALYSGGYSYDYYDVFERGKPYTSLFNEYQMIVWATPWGGPNNIDQNNLISYLDEGGNLFISGQDIGWFIYDVNFRNEESNYFYEDYLKSYYVEDSAFIPTLNGLLDNPISNGFNIDISGGANNQYYPSEIDRLVGTTELFEYNNSFSYGGAREIPEIRTKEFYKNSKTRNSNRSIYREKIQGETSRTFDIPESKLAALNYYDGNKKVIYFAFGFEGIKTSSSRINLMSNIIGWFFNQSYPTCDPDKGLEWIDNYSFVSPTELTVNISTLGYFNECVRVHIDWNNDYVFDVDEYMDCGCKFVNLSEEFSCEMILPINGTNDPNMRIILSYYDYPDVMNGYCNFWWGDVKNINYPYCVPKPEVACDGIDQDCDGFDDEGTDNDNDGFKIEGGLCGEIDCNDENENIYPGAPEIDDNIDQNCQNDAPILDNIDDVIVNEGETVAITASGSDTDGDEITFWINDSRFTQEDNSFTWITPDGSAGVYHVLVSVCDLIEVDVEVQSSWSSEGCLLEDTQVVTITINDLCTPDWECNGYGACAITDTQNCNNVNDKMGCYAQTNLDSDTYNGDYSEFKSRICDYNGFGVIGDLDDFDVVIDNSSDINQNFTGKNVKVEIKKGDEIIIEFDYNFTEPLNLTNVSIEEQDENATKGSILIKGITLSEGGTKTVKMDNIDSNANRICILDQEVLTITEITGDCSGANEISVNCDGSDQNGYTCTLSNNVYTITGLKHSGVSEYTYTAPPSPSGGGGGGGGYTPPEEECIESWSCMPWTTCLPGGIQTRYCRETSNCGTTNDKPEEIKDCEYTPALELSAPEVVQEEPVVETVPELIEEPRGLFAVTGAAITNVVTSKAGKIVGYILIALISLGVIATVFFKIKERRRLKGFE